MTDRAYVDSNILIYYVEGLSELKGAAIDLLDESIDEGRSLFTSEITIGECLIGAAKRGPDMTTSYRELLHRTSFISLVPIEQRLLYRATSLGAELNIKLIDAIHVATAEALGCGVFLTNDRGIRAPAGIELRYLSADA
jgi:predicted nucleic acid-binding protein